MQSDQASGFRPRRIYVASSWRNPIQPAIVAMLRAAGHEAYDFRNPKPGNRGFGWSQIDRQWRRWSPEEFRRSLGHPIAQEGFALDWKAMQWADTGVLVLPCNRSAHLEAGYFTGAGKELHILLGPHNPAQPEFEPELMYKMATSISVSPAELLENLGAIRVNVA